MRKLIYCDESSGKVIRFESFADDFNVMTSAGPRPAMSLLASNKASLTIPGSEPSGEIIYEARNGGKFGNTLGVEHKIGSREKGRELEATLVGTMLTITFGTDKSGESVLPTAIEISNCISNNKEIGDLIVAKVSKAGTGLVNPSSVMLLSGGQDNGDWRKFADKKGNCRRINTIEVI